MHLLSPSIAGIRAAMPAMMTELSVTPHSGLITPDHPKAWLHRNANNIAIVRLLVTQAALSSVSIGFTSSIIRYDLGLHCTFRLSSTWVRFSRSSARCAARTGKSRSRRTVVSTSICPVPIAVTSKPILLAAQSHVQDHTLASQMDQLASMCDITDSICRILRQGAGEPWALDDGAYTNHQDFFTTRAVVRRLPYPPLISFH